MAKKTKNPRAVRTITMPANILQGLKQSGLKRTPPRMKILSALLSASQRGEHRITPEVLSQKIAAVGRPLGLGTIYRNIKILEKKKLIIRHDFQQQRTWYEINIKSHHDHLIDVVSGRVIEFYDEKLEKLQRKIVTRLGYDMIDHRLEIYARPNQTVAPIGKMRTKKIAKKNR